MKVKIPFQGRRCHSDAMSAVTPRFLTLPDVAEILNTSLAQVTALVRRGELRALKLGGRGQWRVETSELETFIERMYAETQQQLREQGRIPATEGLPE
jgi:excisionase family DNA binding protein